MTDDMAGVVARLTKLADDYASRGDFATEDDLRTLLAAYADAARDREAVDARVIVTSNGQPCYRTRNGIPQEMPKKVEAVVRRALAARTGEAR